jgi:broad specificity phosphatase PhoE
VNDATAATTVHLLRHGEVHNPEKILYGRLPGYHLSETGRLMAQRAAEFFAGRDVTVLVSSPMERAQQTAAPIAAKLGLTASLDERLIEAGNQFQGKRFGVGDGALRRPSAWWLLRNPLRPSWGEAYAEILVRVSAAIADARRAAAGHEAVLVSHQLPIWVTRLGLEGRHLWHDPRRRQCSLASVTSLRYDGDRLAGIDYHEPSADLLPGPRAVAGA